MLVAALFAGNIDSGFSQNQGGSAALAPVDDRRVRSEFQKGVEELESRENGTPTEALLKQLKERKSTKLPLPKGPGNNKKLTAPEIYEKARRATLVFGHIYKCDRCTKWHPNVAGGVVIDPSGIAVTNYHVMDNAKAAQFGAMTAGGKVFPVVEVLAASKRDDLAIVRLSGGPFDAVPVSAGDPVGSEVKVISHPDGRFYTFSEGAIARYFFDPKNRVPRLQITADYARGSSGCGVFNEAGELTGVVASTNSIYYTESKDEQKNLQMVVKSCVPATTIRKLTAGDDSAPGQAE